MELTVLDRILLFSILPKEGDITTVRTVRKLREDLSFSDEEQQTIELTTANDKVTWNSQTAVSKEIGIGTKAHALIVQALERLSQDKKLTPEFIQLYDRFITDESQ